MDRVFQFEIFEKYPEIIQGLSKTEYGNMSFRFGEKDKVLESRKKYFADMNVPPEKITGISLVHETKIFDIETSEGNGLEPMDKDGDILFTNKPDTYLFFIIADCLGIFIFDPVKKIISLTHAGWKGVNLEAPKITIQHFKEKYGSDPKDLIVGFTPAIQKESMNFTHTRGLTNEKWAKYIKRNGDETIRVDWIKFALDQIVEEGVLPENVEISQINTYIDENYFSHWKSVVENLPEQRMACLFGFRN